MRQTSTQVFNHRYLEAERAPGSTTPVATAESQPVSVAGNQVTMFITVINATTLGSLTFTLQGSYDGNTWYIPPSSSITSLTSLGSKPLTISEWPYPFARIRAVVTDNGLSDARVIYSGWVIEAAQ